MAKIVEVTNPVTGQPAQVDQLDHTAQQIDDAIARALPGGYYDKWVSQLVNPNLLDNWYFSNPVDQRGGYVVPPGTQYFKAGTQEGAGFTNAYIKVDKWHNEAIPGVSEPGITIDGVEYWCARGTAVRGYTGARYGVDRWATQVSGGSDIPVVTVENDGLVIRGNGNTHLWQGGTVKDIPSGTYTLSLLVSELDGTCNMACYGAKAPILLAVGLNTITFTLKDSNTSRGLYLLNYLNGTIKVKAAKLELGTTQTLAHQDADGNWQLNALPNYADTLARCQRQFIPELRGICVPSGNGDFCAVYAKLPVTMRTAPVFDTGDVQIAAYGSPTIHKSLNGWETAPDCINYINFTGAGNYVGKGIGVVFKNISAEL